MGSGEDEEEVWVCEEGEVGAVSGLGGREASAVFVGVVLVDVEPVEFGPVLISILPCGSELTVVAGAGDCCR